MSKKTLGEKTSELSRFGKTLPLGGPEKNGDDAAISTIKYQGRGEGDRKLLEQRRGRRFAPFSFFPSSPFSLLFFSSLSVTLPSLRNDQKEW